MSLSDSYIMVLDAPERGKHVPVLIGEAEAQAIIMAIEQRHARRPLTHNLICNIMDEYMLTLKQVTIDRFEEGVFYSTLYVSDGFTDKKIDSRTTDAIVLALLQHSSISMNEQVLEETSMDPGALEDNLPRHRSYNQAQTLEELEERLRQCEQNEDYEQAAEIMKRINELKGGKQ